VDEPKSSSLSPVESRPNPSVKACPSALFVANAKSNYNQSVDVSVQLANQLQSTSVIISESVNLAI
jgi:hypothetical protein